MLMVLFVLNDPSKLKELLEAWDEVGVPGVTVLHSTGLGKLRQDTCLWDDLPLLPNIEDFYEREELHSRTLFSVVPDEKMAKKLVEVTQKLIGDFRKPNTGLLVVMPLLKVYGLEKKERLEA
jgi:nitrogen regulatory protein PII